LVKRNPRKSRKPQTQATKKPNLFAEYYKIRIVVFIIIFVLIPFPYNNAWIPYGTMLVIAVLNLLNGNSVNVYNLIMNGLIDAIISMILSFIITLIVLRFRKKL